MRRDKILTKGIAFFAITVLMMGPTMLTSSYAANTSSEVLWQLVYIKKDACKSPDLQVAQMYADLASKYFDLYQLSNSSIEPNCILASEFEAFQKAYGLALVIFVFDEEAGFDTLQANELDGVYAHFGNDRSSNHTVIVCDCSNSKTSYEAASTPWILSHELSHFVLSYKGYSKSAIQNVVHEVENKYQNCVEALTLSEECEDVRITVRTDSLARDFVLMTPYVPAVGNTLIKYISDDMNSEILEIQRDLTNMWIVGSIDNAAFMETLRHFVDPPIAQDDQTIRPYLQMSNGFVITEVVKNPSTDWQEWLNPATQEEKLEPLMKYMPIQLMDTIEKLDKAELPNWFKARALLWTEKRISDQVFFDGLEHLVRIGTINLD